MGSKAEGSLLSRDLPKKRSRLERRTVGGKLEKGSMATRAHDLQEAEAVNRGPLERLGKTIVNDPADRGAQLLTFDRGKIDSYRSANTVA